MARITSGRDHILAEEQEVVTHLLSLVVQHGVFLLPVALEGPKSSPSDYGEGIEQMEPGAAWQCRAGE